MRAKFEKELKILHDDLVEMGFLIEKALVNIIKVLEEYDENALQIIRECEEQVDKLEQKVQSNVLRLLYSQQPVAKDLRSVSAALNLITDMERISDQALDISEIAILFKGKKMIKKPTHIIEMIQKCMIMVNKSIDAFVMQSEEIANSVIAADDEVDQLFLYIRDELIELINEDKTVGEQAIDLIMISKYLERIADHAVNISEWVIFNITGEHKNYPLL